MNKKKILVTGGTGFVGHHLIEALLNGAGAAADEENEIHITSSGSGRRFAWYEQIGGAEHVHQVNLNDREGVLKLLEELQPAEIYHLASIAAVGSSFDQARTVLENNFNLQLNLLEAVALAVPEARVLAVSSGAIYDVTQSPTIEIDEKCVVAPNNPYAASKAIQDMMACAYAQSQKLHVVRVRPFNHIGDFQGPGFAVPDFTKQIVEAKLAGGGEIHVGNLTPKRDFTDVKDVIAAYILLMARGERGEVYNVGSGHSISMQEVLNKLVALAEMNGEIKVVVDEKLVRPVETMDIIANNKKLRALGWAPVIPLDETLKRVYEYWLKFLSEKEVV